MAVYEYKNSAWQEAETPKKYVNSAWEDSDGYACENGVWVEKWSAFPSNYLIKDGVINPAYTIVSNVAEAGNGGTTQAWTYEQAYGRLTCTAGKSTSATSSCRVKMSLSGGITIPYPIKMWIKHSMGTKDNGTNGSRSSLIFFGASTEQAGNSTNGTYVIQRTAPSDNLKLLLWYSNADRYNTRSCTIYDVWFEPYS